MVAAHSEPVWDVRQALSLGRLWANAGSHVGTVRAMMSSLCTRKGVCSAYDCVELKYGSILKAWVSLRSLYSFFEDAPTCRITSRRTSGVLP